MILMFEHAARALFDFVWSDRAVLVAWAMREAHVCWPKIVWVYDQPGGLFGVTRRFLCGKPQMPPIEAKPKEPEKT